MLVCALSAFPLGSTALAQQRDLRPERRLRIERHFYDTEHRDYHEWNAEEDRLYRSYVTARRGVYRDFSRLSKRDQRAYWQWRHEQSARTP
jgi:hypothetical protein